MASEGNINQENSLLLDEILNSNQFEFIGEQNGKIKQIKSIISNTKPNPEKLFIAEGIWAQQKIIETSTHITSLIICPQYIYTNETVQLVAKMSQMTNALFAVSAKTFDKISEKDKPDGIITIAQLPKFDINKFTVENSSLILVLDGIEIPGNIGTMLRMCDGAGVDAVFVCNRKARLSHPKLIKSSQCAVLTVPVFEFDSVESCHNWLSEHDFSVYLADTRAENNYYQENYKNHTAFVMGSERYGISREWYDKKCLLVSIPMLGKCDSLNVGVAATVLIYEATMKIKLNK